MPEKDNQKGVPMSELEDTVRTISSLVTGVLKNPKLLGLLSTSEALAVGMVLDRRDLLDGRTMLGAASRLGPAWVEAAQEVQCQLGEEEKVLGQSLSRNTNANEGVAR